MCRIVKVICGMLILATVITGLHCRNVNESTQKLSDQGGRIAYTSQSGSLSEIFSMNIDGSNKQNLTNSLYFDRDPAYSPDGTRIAFSSDRWTTADIFIMHQNGDNPINLTRSSASSEYYPTFSPDGSRICCSTFYDNWEICLTDPDAGGITRLTETPEIDEWSPKFSPDGTKIAYLIYQAGLRQLWIMDSDGQNPQPLVTEGYPLNHVFSPDGTMLYFSCFLQDQDQDREIYRINSDGSGLIRLTNLINVADMPCVSPDGSKIAFSSLVTKEESTAAHGEIASFDLFIMNTDGSEIKMLTNDLIDFINPVFTPNGNYIIFESVRLGNHDIWRILAEGGYARQLTESVANDHSPTFQ